MVYHSYSPMTVAPTDFMTGMLSPVMRDSSQVERPENTFPSTGTFEPGTTFSRSPEITFTVNLKNIVQQVS
jgi:hypothetical protein